MKKLMLFFLIILYKFCVAQTYFPFPDTTSFWHSVGFDHGSFQEYSFLFGMHGDTIINNYTYSKIYRTPDTSFNYGLEYVCALRENDNKQVLIKLPEDPEFVLYDFNLNIGDTIFYPTGYVVNQNYWGYAGINSYRVVQSIDSILLYDGEYRRRLNLDYFSPGFMDDQWVEGIGSIGKFGLLYPLVSDIYTNLYNYYFGCFVKLNEILVFDSSICYSCLGGYIFNSIKNQKVTLNVTFDHLDKSIRINSSRESDFSFITVYNLTGQTVLTCKSINFPITIISVANLPNGVYFYRITNRKSRIITGKILIS